jgi:hypothetical protein
MNMGSRPGSSVWDIFKIVKKSQYKNVEIHSEAKSVEDMDLYELCRWAALIECVEFIAEHAQERKQKFQELSFPTIEMFNYVDKYSDQYVQKFDL